MNTRRWRRRASQLGILAVVIAGLTTYNYSTNLNVRAKAHLRKLDGVLDMAAYQNLNAVMLDDLSTQAESLAGKKILIAGHAKPTDPDPAPYERMDPTQLAQQLGANDPCCQNPILYKGVRAMRLSKLPYHCYFFRKSPDNGTIAITLDGEETLDFIADAPMLFQGEFEIDNGSFVLKHAKKIL